MCSPVMVVRLRRDWARPLAFHVIVFVRVFVIVCMLVVVNVVAGVIAPMAARMFVSTAGHMSVSIGVIARRAMSVIVILFAPMDTVVALLMGVVVLVFVFVFVFVRMLVAVPVGIGRIMVVIMAVIVFVIVFVIVIVFVFAFVAVFAAVPTFFRVPGRHAMGMSMCMALCGIGAALGLERGRVCAHDQVHRTQHVGQHMVRLDLQVVGLEFDRHMPVAQVVGGAHQVERRPVLGAVGDAQYRLRRGDHAHQRAVFGHQYIATAHGGAAGQKDAQCAARRVGGVEAAFLAHVPVQFNRGSAFEQHRRQPGASRHEFVDGEHGGSGRL